MQHATIMNRMDPKTGQSIAVTTATFARIIGPGKSDSEIPIEVAEEFAKRPDTKTLIGKGKLRILIPKVNAAGEDEVEGIDPAELAKSIVQLDWKAAVKRIESITDLDDLETIYAAESRARVLTAIEARIRFLSEDETSIEAGEKESGKITVKVS